MAPSDAVVCTPPRVEERDGGRTRLEAVIRIGDADNLLWFEAPAPLLASSDLGDAFALAALLPAMRVGLPLRVEVPISAALLSNLDELVAIYSMWFQEFSRIEISVASTTDRPGPSGRGRGLFFSGGVDSFHSFLSNPRPTSHLVYVDALDTIVQDASLLEMIRHSVRSAAEALNRPLIEVSTNIKDVVGPYAEWWAQSHMPIMGSIANALSGGLEACVISADLTYAHLLPLCSHPMLIPLFGSDLVRVEGYGWGTERIDKVFTIVSHRAVLDHLRVCWRNEGAAFNCGRCEKCLRTKIELFLANALDSCTTMPGGLDLAAVAALDLSHGRTIQHARGSRDRAREMGHQPIVDALTTAIRRIEAERAAGRVANDLAAIGDSDFLAPVITAHRDTIYSQLSAHNGRWLTGRVLRDIPGKLLTRLRRIGKSSR